MSKRKQFCDLSTRQKRRRRRQQLQVDLGEEDEEHDRQETTYSINSALLTPKTFVSESTMDTRSSYCEIPEKSPFCNKDVENPTTLLQNQATLSENQTTLLENQTLHLPGRTVVNNVDENVMKHCSLSYPVPLQGPPDSDQLPNENQSSRGTTNKSSMNGGFSLSSELSLWALLCLVPHGTLNLLLRILRTAGHDDLPTDARTLLRTPRKSNIQKFSKGVYIHYGLEGALLYQLANSDVTSLKSEIVIDINVDGLPLAKSSNSSLWPILGRIVLPGFYTTFVIGAYHYYSKPSSPEEFLTPFVEEYMHLRNEGFYYEGKKYIPLIRAVICDSPARSFVTCTKQYNGYYGCPKCTTEGTFLRFVTFLQLDAPLRTDEAFKNRYQEEHHTGTSPFERASLNMVSQFPLDYMHVILLGIMKKLLLMWLTARGIFSAFARAKLSRRLIRLRKWMPREFSRKPRGIDEVKMWKATEFRLFLLYIGPNILRDLLPETHLRHFNALHAACRILCDPLDCVHNNSTAKDLLNWFVRRFVVLYGAEEMVSNVHNLIHISDDVKMFGPLDSYSAFPFENFMQKLKRLLRSPSNPLQQLHRRITEMMEHIKPVDNCVEGPTLLKSIAGNVLLGCSHFHTAVQFTHFYLSIKQPDNCCYMQDGSIVVIEHIGYRNDQPVILGRKFKQLLGMPLYPFDSTLIDVYFASKLSYLSVWLISDIIKKAVMFPINETQFAIMPLLHGSHQ